MLTRSALLALTAAAAALPALEVAIADEDGDVCLAASDSLSKIRKDVH